MNVTTRNLLIIIAFVMAIAGVGFWIYAWLGVAFAILIAAGAFWKFVSMLIMAHVLVRIAQELAKELY